MPRKRIKPDPKIVKLFPKLSVKEIAKITGMNWATIRTNAHKWGLKRTSRFWTPKEERELLRDFKKIGYIRLAKKFNRSSTAVYSKYYLLLEKKGNKQQNK